MVYYEHDLALIHARGYGGYADYCAPDILSLLEPVRAGSCSSSAAVPGR